MAPASRIDLTNQFLIAMPGMADDRFAGSVVYLVGLAAHTIIGRRDFAPN